MRADESAGVAEPPTETCTAPGSVAVCERVRWSDVDAAGIVCFGKYLRFFELAEAELFHRAGLPVSVLLDRHDLWLVRRRLECEFFRPLRLDEDVRISARVAAVGETSVQLSFLAEAPQRNETIARGDYVLVCVGRSSFEKRSVPPEMRRALEPFRHSPAAVPD